MTAPASCAAEPIPDPEPPAPDDLPTPPASWTAAPEDLRAWVNALAVVVVQYAISQRERGDLLTVRLESACASIEAQRG